MKFALINPNWQFNHSIYFGCTHYHLPLELGYSKALLELAGHHAIIIDGHLHDLTNAQIYAHLKTFDADITVITTAPSYLFWRCPPPELAVPMRLIDTIADIAGIIVAIGPHGSITPGPVLKKLNVDALVLGEPEEILPLLAWPRHDWHSIPSICYSENGQIKVQGFAHSSNVADLPVLHWPDEHIFRHSHHHHRFEKSVSAPGAEMEASRGCPYHCSFCAKHSFRDKYRRRKIENVLAELDYLISQSTQYIYFIDEIFIPDSELIAALAHRPVEFGIQTRIDIWQPEQLDKLGAAGCVSIEAGIESISDDGRRLLNKNCNLTTPQLTSLLIRARQTVPFVQATLIQTPADDPEHVDTWRDQLIAHGIWVNQPVPIFPYPGSLEYTRRWGLADDQAWQRAHDHYISSHYIFSDIQDSKPLPLAQLEAGYGS